MTTLLQVLGLIHEQVRSQHNAITYNIDLASLEDAGRNATQHILLALEFQGMASIRTSLKACDNIVAWREHVNYFSFSFIAPLQSQ